MQITICKSEVEPDSIQTVECSWSELEDTLREFRITACNPCAGKKCESKRGPGWIPAAFGTRYRTDVNVISVTVATLDLDNLPLPDLEAALERVKALRYIVHSTHSHDSPSACAVRLVMPLSRPVSPKEWRTFFPALLKAYDIPADPVCKNPSRLFYAPSAPEGRETLFRLNDGVALDVDELLKSARPPAEVTDPAGEENYVELASVRSMLLSLEHTKARSKHKDPARQAEDKAMSGVLARIRQGQPIAVPGDHRGDSSLPRGRDAALNQAISTIAFHLPVTTPWEAVAEVLRETIYSMAMPEGIAHWLREAKDMFARAVRRREELDAQNGRATQAVKSALDRIRKTGRLTDIRPDEVMPTAEDVGHHDDLGAWKSSLKPNAKNDGYAANGFNIQLILTFAEGCRGTFRWNDVTRQIETVGGIFEGTHKSILDTAVADWLTDEWGIQLSTVEVGKRILAVARQNSYDPVRDYLTALVWDETPRIDTWLRDYCKAATKNEDGDDIAHLVDLVGARCLMSLAARGLTPGCKADDVLILEGSQGIRKSSALKVLGGEWYVSDSLHLGDKDSKLLASRAWLVELAEITSLKRGDLDAIKAFISTSTDVLRPPYGSAHEEFPRRCVFAGTVNPEGFGDYLTDRTGNRRFRPVRCDGRIDIPGLSAARDQLFAEAVVRVKGCMAEQAAGKSGGDIEPRLRWWFEPNEDEELEAKVTNQRVASYSTRVEEICRWWHSLAKKPERILMADVIRGVFPDMAGRTKRGDEIELGLSLSKAGFRRQRLTVAGAREWFYVPHDVKTFGVQPAQSMLTAVANVRGR